MTNNVDITELVGTDEWAAVNDTGRPFVVYKFATTLDGRVAAADGTSKWVTSSQSRAEVHFLRSGCHATMVGSGTQRVDNPRLAIRGVDDPRVAPSMISPENQPIRVIVDSNARTPADANVLDDTAPTLIAVADDADASHLEGRAVIVRVPRAERGLNLRVLLSELWERDVQAIFLEGGPTLAGSFIGQHLVDRVINYVAPALLGAGKPGLGDAGITTMADIVRLEIIHLDRSGPDVRIISRPVRIR